jgi:hypothetical protein
MAAMRYRFFASKPTATSSGSREHGSKRSERNDDIESIISDNGSVGSSNQSENQD